MKDLESWRFERLTLRQREWANDKERHVAGECRRTSANGEGLTLETSAFQIFHSGNSTFIHSFYKTLFSCFTLQATQPHSFIKN